MGESPKISVIVPVYNVEEYLRKCVQSIIDQTYSNIEIILVDDGSKDGSGYICDEFAKQDRRVKVIHKPNGGVSSARNTGLAVAAGDWIGWVDSDDWIEPSMFATLLERATACDADIAVCSRYECYKDKCVCRGWSQEEIFNTEQALLHLLQNDAMQNFLWDKLWKRSLFHGIVFPEGKTYEDIAMMHRLFEKAKKIVCLPNATYHYRQRAGSIVSDTSLGNRINHYVAAKQRYEEMEQRWPQFCNLLEAQCVASAVGVWCAYWKNPRNLRKAMRPEIKEMAEFAKTHCASARKYMNLGITGRMVLRIIPYPTWWSFMIASICSWVYEQKHGKPL